MKIKGTQTGYGFAYALLSKLFITTQLPLIPRPLLPQEEKGRNAVESPSPLVGEGFRVRGV